MARSPSDLPVATAHLALMSALSWYTSWPHTSPRRIDVHNEIWIESFPIQEQEIATDNASVATCTGKSIEVRYLHVTLKPRLQYQYR